MSSSPRIPDKMPDREGPGVDTRYAKQPWVEHETPVDAAHMNHIEDGIANAIPPWPAYALFDSGAWRRFLKGWVGADGSIYGGGGYTVQHTGTGVYVVTPTGFVNGLPFPMLIPADAWPITASVTIAGDQFTARFYDAATAGAPPRDTTFMFWLFDG